MVEKTIKEIRETEQEAEKIMVRAKIKVHSFLSRQSRKQRMRKPL